MAIENEKHLRSNDGHSSTGSLGRCNWGGSKKRWRMGVKMFCSVCTLHYYVLPFDQGSIKMK